MHIHIHVLEKIDSAVAAALKIYINFGDSPQLLTSKHSSLGRFLVILWELFILLLRSLNKDLLLIFTWFGERSPVIISQGSLVGQTDYAIALL